LSLQHAKQLRTYTKDLCDTLEIPEKNLLDFIETCDLFHMLLNMKASLIKYEIDTHANKSNILQETLASKDFEIALHNCLLACLLSPNINAYVMDMQRHIMVSLYGQLGLIVDPANNVMCWSSSLSTKISSRFQLGFLTMLSSSPAFTQ
ncbi:hypothetical protein PISMIDRAFT_117227, partial [Pisolithus microcarpus 441]